jgi:beta-glucosidase
MVTTPSTANDASPPSFPDLSQIPWQEKLKWLNGYDIWCLHPIPGITPSSDKTSIRMSDGPHGVRKPLSDLDLAEAYPATTFPSACATACSWDPQLLHTMGRALAKECEYYDVQVLLGPGVNLKRYPTGGRNHEYFSEDPYLTGRLACGYIEGVQHTGRVASCVKHFCLNNQESHRMVVDVLCDERALRELYLPAFEMSIRDRPAARQPRTIMTAYNRVEGEYASESVRLLKNILRDEWGFAGLVLSDWAAVSDRVEALRAGMDLEMPGSKGAYDAEVRQAIYAGTLDVAAIDECAERVARLVYDYQPKGVHHDYTDTSKAQGMFDEHDKLARRIAQDCIVLLQNQDNFLPLDPKKTRKIAIIGDFAKNSRYQGMGSAHATPTRVTSLYTALQDMFQSDGGDFSLSYAPGYDADEDDDEVHQQLIDEAVAVAKQGDVVLVNVGLPEIMESEGFDRPHIHMPEEHVSLVDAICKVHPNVVVMLSNGGIVTIPESVVKGAKAILDGFLLGQAGGGAMVDVIFGHVNPNGKLSETIPVSIDDIPAAAYFPGSRDQVQYREGLNVGYRYFNTQNINVRFPFGHGLSYTTFQYQNMKIEIHKDEETTKQVMVSLDVKNTGSKAGKEVVQLYVKPVNSSVYRPCHELKSFQKVKIEPGQSQRVEFELDFRSFAFFDIGCNDWIVESGPCTFEIQIGASSRDIRLAETVQFMHGTEPTKEAQQSYPNNIMEESKAFISTLEDEAFAKRFGLKKIDIILRMIAEEKKRRAHKSLAPIHRNTLLIEAAQESLIAKALMRFTIRVASKRIHEGPTKKREIRMITANVENLPLRNLVLFSQGNISFEFLDSLILLMNGRYWNGIRGIILGNKKTRKLTTQRTESQESLM